MVVVYVVFIIVISNGLTSNSDVEVMTIIALHNLSLAYLLIFLASLYKKKNINCIELHIILYHPSISSQVHKKKKVYVELITFRLKLYETV